MEQVKYSARFFSVLNLRKGEHFLCLTVVKILPESIQMFLRIVGLYPHLHVAAIRLRAVARKLFLIKGRANEIAFKDLLSPCSACGAQSNDLLDCRDLVKPLGGHRSNNKRQIRGYHKQARNQNHGLS